MIQLAFYGKGGIGKSTTVSNLATALAERGQRVVQIGCDPKADSTMNLCHGQKMVTVMDMCRQVNDAFDLEDVVVRSESGVYCAETGGPLPGVGCAGRGVITALEKLTESLGYSRTEFLDKMAKSFLISGDVKYAQSVYILTSSEAMSIYAAANIAMAVDHFKARHYAKLGGFIFNRKQEGEKASAVQKLAADFHSTVVGTLADSERVRAADDVHRIVMETEPDSETAAAYRQLAETIYLRETGGESC